MAEKQVVTSADEGSIDANAFLGTLAGAIKDAMKAGVQEVNPKRDNPNYIPDSVFAPAGVVKEPLTRRVIFKGIVQEDAQLTPEETHLFNQLQPTTAVITMTGLPRQVTVVQENKGTIPDLKIDFPLSIEERAYMPSLVKMLRALIAGASVIE